MGEIDANIVGCDGYCEVFTMSHITFIEVGGESFIYTTLSSGLTLVGLQALNISSSSLTTNQNSPVQTIITWDVSAAPTTVPIPAAVWLFGSGLIGLAGVARRKKA